MRPTPRPAGHHRREHHPYGGGRIVGPAAAQGREHIAGLSARGTKGGPAGLEVVRSGLADERQELEVSVRRVRDGPQELGKPQQHPASCSKGLSGQSCGA